MSRRKVSTTIYLEPMQFDLLRLLAQRTRLPMAELIRDGSDMILRAYEDLLPEMAEAQAAVQAAKEAEQKAAELEEPAPPQTLEQLAERRQLVVDAVRRRGGGVM